MLSRLLKKPTIDWNGKYLAKCERARHPVLLDFYSAPLPERTTPINQIKFLALDFETTGLDRDKDEIITVGMVPFDLNRIYLNQARHWLVKPRKALKESSIVIHGITHNDIMNAPDLSLYLQQIIGAMKGYIVVAHYHAIERYFFSHAVKRQLGEEIEFPIVDTMQVEETIIRRHFGFMSRLKGEAKPSLRLGATRARYALPPYSPHHALTDAIATAELLQAQISQNFDPATAIEQFWL